MAVQREFTFAPDRRTIEGSYYQIGNYNLQSGLVGVEGEGAYQQESYREVLTNIYNEKFKNRFSIDKINELVNRLITKVPMANVNINYIAYANFFLDDFIAGKVEWNPSTFTIYFERIIPSLIENVQGKTPDQINALKLEHKLVMFRYSEYILKHLKLLRI